MTEKLKPKVLFIDDERDSLIPIPFILKEYDVQLATSGEEGLKLLDSSTDIVISDQRMPRMTGLDTLRECKSRYPDTIRILLTAWADLDTVMEALNDAEVYRCLTKPCRDFEMKKVIRDALEIRDLQNAQKRLASLGTIAAGLSHELNTPLGYVIANTELLREGLILSPEIDSLISGISIGAEHIHKVIQDIETITTIGISPPVLHDFNQLIQESISDTEIPTRIKIRAHLSSIPKFIGYPEHYQKIIAHLLKYAMNAKEKAGEINICTGMKEDYAVLIIGDTEQGIGGLVEEQSFNSFFSTQASGVGLGLTISRAITEACGGTLSLHWTDEGSEARLRLPIIREVQK
jgi:signal transduction histidine kinase